MEEQLVHVGAQEHYERVVGFYDFFRYTFFGWQKNPVIVISRQGMLFFDLDLMCAFVLADGQLCTRRIWGLLYNTKQQMLILDVAYELSGSGSPLPDISSDMWKYFLSLCGTHDAATQRLLHLQSCADLLREAVP